MRKSQFSEDQIVGTLIVETWRQDYNQHRPHSALAYCIPSEFRRE